MSLTEVVFWCAYVGGVLYAALNPAVAVALYVLVYHLNPETQWWGGSARAIGLRTAFVVACAAGLGMLLRRPTMPPGSRVLATPFIFALAFTVLAVVSPIWALESTPRMALTIEKIIKLMVIIFIFVRCVHRPADYHLVVLAWVLGVAYMGYQAHGGAGRMFAGRLSQGIGGSDFEDSSSLAAHLVATLPMIGALFFMSRTLWTRALVLITGALACNTLIMTRTRNALVGLACMAVVMLARLPRGYRLKGFLAAILGTILAAQLADPHWWERMGSITEYRSDPSATNRLAYWAAAVRMAIDHPLGVGLSNYYQQVMVYVPGLTQERSAHNTFLMCLAELGWLGLVLFVTVVTVTIRHLGAARRASYRLPTRFVIRIGPWTPTFHLGWHALALQAGLFGYLGSALFTTRLFAEDMWLLVALAMCLVNVQYYVEAHEAELQLQSWDGRRPSAVVVPDGSLPHAT